MLEALLGAVLTYTVMMSENFSYNEFVHSETALIHGIDNRPDATHIQNGKLLFNKVMQPIRDHWGPVIITSGYRNPKVNELVGGIDNSQHIRGEAADFIVRGHNNRKILEWIAENLEFDQLILEPSWIHVSYSSFHNRKEVLIYHEGEFHPYYK